MKPDGGESGLYTFCADHLERKLFERDVKHETKRKMKRENTFSLYATDSDSGNALYPFRLPQTVRRLDQIC